MSKFREPDGEPLKDAGAWKGERVVVVGTGPSLASQDLELVDRSAERGLVRVIAVNDAWMSLRAAHALYAADHTWWKVHQGAAQFGGRRITQNRGHGYDTARKFGLECCTLNPEGFSSMDPAIVGRPSFSPELIGNGMNSGFQAVNIAALMGSRDIVLLGFDMQRGVNGKRHWFGDHPPGLHRESPYALFVECFNVAAPIYAAAGVSITNSTRRTALACFPRRRLEGALNATGPGQT